MVNAYYVLLHKLDEVWREHKSISIPSADYWNIVRSTIKHDSPSRQGERFKRDDSLSELAVLYVQRIKLYDHATGECRDGLQQNGANENQGAESTLSYILSLLAVYNLRGLTTNERKNKVPEFESPLAGRAGKRLKLSGGP